MLDELLERVGLKYEDLNETERETVMSWADALNEKSISVDLIRSYISRMKDSVENELAVTGHEYKKDIYLKARLRNYLLLEAFLTSPEKARAAIEKTLKGIRVDRK